MSLVDEIRQAGGEVKALSVTSYEQSTLHATFASRRVPRCADSRRGLLRRREGLEPSSTLRRKDLRSKVDTSIIGSSAFAREAILEFNNLDPSVRENQITKAFAVGNSRAVAKSYQAVLTSILDGHISTNRCKARLGDKCDKWSTDEDRPESTL
ncbi:hypothetical protein EXIGLDRAFT_772517 [Exidia glandulosa HHB12029]|uniref:Uncharacterized protein n=1 Tax=Exidia glandulosa HHB12029 TaxID=1314781 RepID=A0A165F9B7_EXIGL|nr:hypothetical protein EXIGLDRAFT_772517 [Exidia glandulosa HHB12029]